MAGTYAGFDATAFREGILFAMQMGSPPDPALRPRFVFPAGVPTYEKNGVPVTNPRLDRDGNPMDPDIELIQSPGTIVQVPCAVEITKADAEEVPVGNFRPTKALVTFLDSDYLQVKGCREMVYNGDRYGFSYVPEALGMFDVGVFTMVFFAIRES